MIVEHCELIHVKVECIRHLIKVNLSLVLLLGLFNGLIVDKIGVNKRTVLNAHRIILIRSSLTIETALITNSSSPESVMTFLEPD